MSLEHATPRTLFALTTTRGGDPQPADGDAHSAPDARRRV